jgi:hypothetical protein
MNRDDSELRKLTFMPSRVPALDALEVFVPTGDARDAEFDEVAGRTGESRWYPVEGGHRVLILYEEGPYDTGRFVLRKGAWDHDHCGRCGAAIPSMTLCFVTEDGEYVLLDEACHRRLFGPDPDLP